MEELIERVEKDLDNNWPVDANDIRLLIITIRTLNGTLDSLADLGRKI